MKLDEAFVILEVNNVENIVLADLPKIAKRAKKRWHPDRIPLLNQDPDLLQLYQENFVKIEEAVDVLQAYLEGRYHAASQPYSSSKQQSGEPILREHVAMMQGTLKSIFEQVVAKKFLFHQEDVVLTPGSKVKDLLKADLDERVPYFAALSFGIFSFMASILSITTAFFTLEHAAVRSFIWTVIYSCVAFQGLACFIGLLPLSRFWLPQSISNGVATCIDFPFSVMKGLLKRVPFLKLLFFPLNLYAFGIALAVHILAWLLYQPAIWIFGDLPVRQVIQKQNFYGNFPAWYIQQLFNKEPEDLSEEELTHLGDMFTQLRDVTKTT